MNKKIVITFIFALLIGAGVGYWSSMLITEQNTTGMQGMSGDEQEKVIFYRNPMNPAITSPVPAQDEMGMDYIPVYAEENKPKEKKALFYRNPMNPAITSPVPAQDEMGMDYIPVYADKDGDDKAPAGTVSIDPVVVQNIGVRSVVAERKAISRTLNALGRVDFNEEYLARLHPKTTGWIEKLYIDETGTDVKKDAILLNIYSPDLVAAQREYLLALKNRESLSGNVSKQMLDSAKTLLKSALERLELLDVPTHQIQELKKSRKIKKYLHIHSPFAGTIMHIGSREGQYITPKDELYLIADLNKIWVYVDIYEDEMPWVKLGDKANMTVRAAPGRIFEGEVSFIYPYLVSKTRTVRVRLEFDNKDLVLKPGMFANIVLETDTQLDSIVIPSEAIVRSGSREQVFVVKGEGKFEPKEVTLGLSSAGFTQILEGLEAGEQVVTSALFLIDSESKLREATAKMLQTNSMQSNMEMQDMDMDMDMGMEEMDMNMGEMSMDELDMSDMNMDMNNMSNSSVIHK